MKKYTGGLSGISFFLFFMSAQVQAETLLGYSGGLDTLYTIDTIIATATPVGTDNSGICSEIELGGGVVYAADTGLNTNLHSIDPLTGLVTGTLTMIFPPGGDVLTALEFVGGTLYAGLTTEGGGPTFLTTVNLTTGVVTMVGPTGVLSPLGGLAYDTVSGTMYACSAGGSAGQLFTINLATGAATLVGPITVGGNNVGTTALEFGPSGTLYSLPNTGARLAGHLLSVNPATGVAIDLGDLGIADMNALTTAPIAAVVPPKAVPTLSEWVMIIMGLLLLFMAFKRMRKNRDLPA